MGTELGTGGRTPGRPRQGMRGAAVALALVAAAAGCGGSGGDGSDAAIDDAPGPDQAPSTQAAVAGPECSSGRPAVVIDLGMTALTLDSMIQWFDGGPEAPARPGGAALLQAYRERGYDVIYLSSIPADRLLEDRPVSEVMTEWLQANGYPNGPGTHLVMWDMNVTDQVSVYKTQVLLDLATNGTTAYYGYGDDALDIRAMRNAGLPADRIFSLGEVAGSEGTTALPSADGDWSPHLQEFVEPLPAACAG